MFMYENSRKLLWLEYKNVSFQTKNSIKYKV